MEPQTSYYWFTDWQKLRLCGERSLVKSSLNIYPEHSERLVNILTAGNICS